MKINMFWGFKFCTSVESSNCEQFRSIKSFFLKKEIVRMVLHWMEDVSRFSYLESYFLVHAKQNTIMSKQVPLQILASRKKSHSPKEFCPSTCYKLGIANEYFYNRRRRKFQRKTSQLNSFLLKRKNSPNRPDSSYFSCQSCGSFTLACLHVSFPS